MGLAKKGVFFFQKVLTKRYQSTIQHAQLDRVGDRHQTRRATDILLLLWLLEICIPRCAAGAMFPLAGRYRRCPKGRTRSATAHPRGARTGGHTARTARTDVLLLI